MAGVVHWFEDHYLDDNSKYKFISEISKDNTLHHNNPVALTKLTHWENINTTCVIVLPLILCLYLFGVPNFILWVLGFSIFANLIHKYAHMHPKKVPYLVRQMQKIGVFISFDHHEKHHYDKYGLIPKEKSVIRFCPMTNWVNPILDYTKFWFCMDYIFSSIIKRVKGYK